MSIVTTGMTMRIIPRMTYTLTPLVANAFTGIIMPIARCIDVGPFTEAEWQVRVHAVTLNGGSFSFGYGFEGFTLDDPATNFQTTATTFGLTTAGQYTVQSITGPFGRLMYAELLATGPTSTSTFSITLSADIVCKNGDPSGCQPGFNTYRGYR